MGSVKSRANVVKKRKNERDRKSWPRSCLPICEKKKKEKERVKNVGRLHKRRGWKKNERGGSGRRGGMAKQEAHREERPRKGE